MAERLKYYGVHSEVEIYEGKKHAWFNSGKDNRITTERIASFIERMFGVKAEQGGSLGAADAAR